MKEEWFDDKNHEWTEENPKPKELKPKELKEIVRLHELWLKGDKRGKRAVLKVNTIARKCDLRGVNLEKAVLRLCELRLSNFEGANLQEVDFSGSSLTGCNLINTNLIHANFHHAKLIEADLRNAVCRATDFGHAWLASADFRGADLHNAIITFGPDFHHLIIDDVIYWYMIQQLKRVDITNCSKEVREHYKKISGADKFLKDYVQGHFSNPFSDVPWPLMEKNFMKYPHKKRLPEWYNKEHNFGPRKYK